MRSHELAKMMLEQPDMELLVHVNESGVAVLGASVAAPRDTRKKFLVLSTADWQEIFIPEARMKPLT